MSAINVPALIVLIVDVGMIQNFLIVNASTCRGCVTGFPIAAMVEMKGIVFVLTMSSNATIAHVMMNVMVEYHIINA